MDSRVSISATPKARTLAHEYNIDLLHITPSGKQGEIVAIDVMTAKSRRSAITPLARRIAADRNIDLSFVKGSGHAGKIYCCDLPSEGDINTVKRVRMTPMRKAIANAMTASHVTIPAVTQNTEVDTTGLFDFRKKLNETLSREKRISVNDLFISATAIAIRENERLRYQLDGDDYLVHENVNISMAVSVDGGLVVPVIRDADKLSIHEISAETKRLATASRNNKLTMEDFKDGVFTVSNLGMYGINSFTPIINIPQSAILGICAPIERLVMDETDITVHTFLTLSLTYDHRIINGAEAAVFVSRIKGLIENPGELWEMISD